MQSPDVKARAPLRDMAPREQNLKSSKRELPTAEKWGSKKKIKHKPDGMKDILPTF